MDIVVKIFNYMVFCAMYVAKNFIKTLVKFCFGRKT